MVGMLFKLKFELERSFLDGNGKSTWKLRRLEFVRFLGTHRENLFWGVYLAVTNQLEAYGCDMQHQSSFILGSRVCPRVDLTWNS